VTHLGSRRAPALYVITDRRATGGRPLPEVIARVLAAAAPNRDAAGRLPVAISLREKDLPAVALTRLANEVRALTKIAGADLFVNSRLDVALACGADGVHLPSEGLTPVEVRAVAPQLRIATSTHTFDDVARAAEHDVDFVVFGPIFETPSKQGMLSPRGVEAVRAVTKHGVPVLALGGIIPDNAGLCLAAGASGVACIRAVLAATDPGLATMAFLAQTFEQKRADDENSVGEKRSLSDG
jgi:thiamine-phosphate pyrophosphorylase